MRPVQATLSVPGELWNAVRLLAAEEGDPNSVGLRASEEYVTAEHARRRPQSLGPACVSLADDQYQVRPRTGQKSPVDVFRLSNFGHKSLREVKEKLATLRLTLGMTLDDDSYRAAVVATVAAHIRTRKG